MPAQYSVRIRVSLRGFSSVGRAPPWHGGSQRSESAKLHVMADRKHVLIFLANASPQPWPCHFCGEDVWLQMENRNGARALLVHHLDDDHHNDVAENLVSCHRGCHTGYTMTKTMTGRTLTEEHKEKISKTLRDKRLKAGSNPACLTAS